MNAPQIGDVLAGKYRVERVLGVGGMGMVVAALHLELDQMVALKFMREEMLSSRDAVDRFLREARAAVRLKSEHICRVMDVGRMPNDVPYIVLEYLEGRNLLTELEQRGALPPGEVVELLLQACEGMAEAHALGIIHRDLKPQNLFLGRRPDGAPFVKVLDFGVAKTQVADAVSTRAGSTMGSPAYLSPEQWRSAKDVDARTDVYALGVILFQLLTGQLPIEAPTLPELCLKAMSEQPPTLRSIRAELPVGLEPIVQRCLAKTPEQRYDNVVDLAAALMPFAPLRSRDALSLISKALHVPAPSLTERPASPAGRVQPIGAVSTLGESAGELSVLPLRGPRRRRAMVLGGVAMALGAAVCVLLATRGGNGGQAVQPSTRSTHDEVGVPPSDASEPRIDSSVPLEPDAALIEIKPRSDAGSSNIKINSRGETRDAGKPTALDAAAIPIAVRTAAPPDAAVPQEPKCDPDRDPTCLFKTNQ